MPKHKHSKDTAVSSSSKSNRPTGKAPQPPKHKKNPLTTQLELINEMLAKPEHDASVLKNARKALLEQLRDDIPDADEDLSKLFSLAKKTKDDEIIHTVLDQFTIVPISNKDKLLDNIINTFEELGNVSKLMSFFSKNTYTKKLEKIIRLGLAHQSISLHLEERIKLLKIACRDHDYILAAEVLSAHAEHPDRLRRHTEEVFDVLAAKIDECYNSYNMDAKFLFRLVAIKNLLESQTYQKVLDFSHVPVEKVKAYAQKSLFHNNIQFVEVWIRLKPDLLHDVEFKNQVIAKYKEALKSLISDSNARNGFGVSAINALLKSEVLKDVSLRDLFPNQEYLSGLIADTDPEIRSHLMPRLLAKEVLHKDLKEVTMPDLVKACREGDVAKVEHAINQATKDKTDLSKMRFRGMSLLFHAVSYEYDKDHKNGKGWPNSVLRKDLKEQAKDEDFKLLSERKNQILKRLLNTGWFTRQDVQDAYDKTYRDGLVKKTESNGLPTDFAFRGDQKLTNQLLDKGANAADGKSFIGIWRAVTISYTTALSVDFIAGTTADLLEHYFKVPNFYKKVFSPLVSAGASAAAFEATGAVVNYYHNTLNPDYFNNNSLNFNGRIVAGTYQETWYGGVVFGHHLEKKMRNKVGISNVENAVFDMDDITDRNKFLHHMIGDVVYNTYRDRMSELEIKKKKSVFPVILKGVKDWITKKFNKSDPDFFNHLEAANKKCQYGIPGDDSYSFNREFQAKLANLFDEDGREEVIDSIVSFPDNTKFFLEFAKGVEQGLVKTKLDVKKNILDTYKIVLERLKARNEDERSKNEVPRGKYHVFGALVKLYEKHSTAAVPLSVLLVSQHFKEMKNIGAITEGNDASSLKMKFILLWDKGVGYISNKFGISKEEGHDIVGKSAQLAFSTLIGVLNYYENQVRSEIIKQGPLKSFTFITTSLASIMTGLHYSGISPLLPIPPIIFIGVLMYCREHKIDLLEESKKIWKGLKSHHAGAGDSTGVFVEAKTASQFEELYAKIQITAIPPNVAMAI